MMNISKLKLKLKLKQKLKRPMTYVLISCLLAVPMVSCNKKSSNSEANNSLPPATTQDDQNHADTKNEIVETITPNGGYEYWYIRNGCSTQKQSFPSKEALCRGLQDKDLNKNCAVDLRQNKFSKENCPGTFAEFSSPTPPSSETSPSSSAPPSPIQCVGKISGRSGTKIINETIEWDRKTFQKIILSKFTDLADAGEYSLHLLPANNENPIAGMRIFGWFIDNNKNQSVESKIDSEVTLRHKDSSLNNRTVDIKCALVKPDLPLPSYSQHEEIPMTCLGSYGAIQGNTKPLSANFKWNPKKSISKELTYFQDDKNLPAGIKLILDPIQKNGSGTIKAQTDGLDGHVHIFGQSKGRLDLSITYISAWDNRQFQFTCLPEHVWKETAEQWKKNN